MHPELKRKLEDDALKKGESKEKPRKGDSKSRIDNSQEIVSPKRGI